MRAAAGLWLSLLAIPAAAQDRIGVRTGDHPGFGRIVFDWAAAPRYQVEQQGERVLLRFPNADAIDLAGARRLARNLLAVGRVEGGIELTLRPGTRIRHFRNGPKVALDILDAAEGTATASLPPAIREASTARRPNRAATAGTPPAASAEVRTAVPQAPMVAVPASPAPPAIVPPTETPRSFSTAPSPLRDSERPLVSATGPRPLLEPSPVAVASAPPPSPPLASLAGPLPIRARLVGEAGQGPTLRLAVGTGVGAAALRRGEQALLLLDTERSIEFGAVLREPAFAGIQAQRLPGATLITWTMAPDTQLALRQEGGDWFVSPVPGSHPAPAAVASLRAEFAGDRAILHAARPSRVLTMNDPLTGLPLLIGTVGQAAPRQMTTRNLAEFDLIETYLGVAVLARADRLALRAGAERFLLSVQGGAIALAGEPLDGVVAAIGMTRSFDIPGQPVSALQERLRAQQAGVGAAAPLLRGEPRIAAAQTLLALGLPQEAQAMLRLAAQENPPSALDPRQIFLSGMSALLAGRSAEGRGLDAELPTSDEVILWRALRSAMQGDANTAAPGLAATLPLLLSYPEGLRRRLLPIAGEAMAEGGQHAAARRLLDAAGEDASLLLAQAMLEEAQGDTARALETYEAAAASRDRLMRARATRRSVELRLASGGLDAAGAARVLEQTLFAWRGDAQEIGARERLAALRRAAGDPRAALALLRETEAMFPERGPVLRELIQQAFLQALEVEPALGAVGLYDAHPELLPSGEAGEAMLALLADRLSALDLADRAAGLLRRAMERAPAGEGRAGLGARLAAQRLRERDAEGALSALAASSAPRLPPALVEARSLLAAQAEARRGNRALAMEALQALGPAGDETLADILTDARDYAGAAAALSRHLAATVPGGDRDVMTEPLQRTALRNAALLAMAGDEDGLAAHRRRYAARMGKPELAAAFEALTADPVRGLADLPRLARELNLFRLLPQTLEPLRTAQHPAG